MDLTKTEIAEVDKFLNEEFPGSNHKTNRINVFLGPDMNTSNPEHRKLIVEEMKKAMKQLANGEFEEVEDLD